MTDPRSELAEWAKPAKAAPKRKHHWQLVERWPRTEKHRCTACALVRVKISDPSRFPLIKYRTAAGVESRGRTPECQ